MRLAVVCLRNLLRRRGRTALCIVSITLTVMSVVTVGSIASKYTEIIVDANTFFKDGIVVVSRGVFVVQTFPIGGSMPETIIERLKVEGAKEVIPMLFVIGPTQLEGATQIVPSNITFGLPAGNWSVLVQSTPLQSGGSWPSSDSAKEIVVGPSLADNFNLTVGSLTKIKTYDLEVVGVLDRPSSILFRAVIMPLKTSQEIYGYSMLVNMVIVKPDQHHTDEEVAARIESEVPGVKALTVAERGQTVEPLISEVAFWNAGIKSILFLLSMMLVTAVTMMNVSERRREFATLHAIGAPRLWIARMVLTETAFLGFVGGLLGLSLGAFVSLQVTSYYVRVPLHLMYGDVLSLVPPILMLETLASVVIVCCIAGLVPAFAAARTYVAGVMRAEY